MCMGNGMSIERVISKLKPWLNKIVNRLRKVIGQCSLCGQDLGQTALLCDNCESLLPRIQPPNKQYDLLHWPAIYQLFQPLHFDHLIVFAPYEWPLSHWIIQVKYQQQFHFCQLLGQLLAKQWQSSHCQADIIIPVPIASTRWVTRGFNQSLLLAQQVSNKTHIPLDNEIVVRQKHQKSQVGLTSTQRRRNMKDNFSVVNKNRVEGKSIILIDDVITTGATVQTISQQLKAAGAHTVTVLCVCITLP